VHYAVAEPFALDFKFVEDVIKQKGEGQGEVLQAAECVQKLTPLILSGSPSRACSFRPSPVRVSSNIVASSPILGHLPSPQNLLRAASSPSFSGSYTDATRSPLKDLG
jgi:hypothetical protein